MKRLSAEMVKSGFVGFAGLCDLPGTVAAAIYGNAGCYGCDLSSKLYSCDILLNDGLVKTYYKEDIEFSVRMSSFKSKAIEGVILRIRLALEKGSAEEEILKATEASTNRKKTQPGPLNNLGSIYSSKQTYTFKGRFLTLIAKGLSLLNRKSMLHNVLLLTGKKSLLPYVCHWNRYIWKDEKAHNLWPMFVKLHAQIFRNDKFEIEILT